MTNRRSFMKMALACGAYGILARPTSAASRKSSISLWNGTPPGGGGPKGPLIISKGGSVRNISVPSMDVYLPDQAPKGVMLIAGGGGYKHIEIKKEALAAANWLTERGIAACVLYYRLPDEGWLEKPLAPLQDAQRALRLLHSSKVIPNIRSDKIGVIGFSAGGHLMAMAAARSEFRSYQPLDDIDQYSAHPAFAVFAYPVITLEPPYDNTSTRKVLIGRHPTPQQSALWSVQTHVKRNFPAAFLVQAANDPISNPENTVILQSACKKVGVPVERHLLASGGHGFSMGMKNSPTAQWPTLLEKWLQARNII
ncbi:alpha/beta hydrolase [Bartonella sp. LJL80]